jgi:hypothetical protein
LLEKRLGVRVSACALGLLAAALFAAPAGAAGVSVLPPTSTAVKAATAMERPCAARELSPGRGVSVTQWTATDDGSVTAHLAGGESSDWDLALFDAASGRRLDASEAPGANEVVQTLVRRGQTLLIQACRLSGSASREPLTISPVAAPLAQTPPKPSQQSLVSIPIAGPQDIPALESLGLNLDEAGPAREATAVLSGPGQAAALTRAGFTFKTLVPDLTVAEQGYRAQDAAAAAAGPSALPSGRNDYRHYPDIQADLKKIVADHPNLARPVVLPKKSFQGRDIQGIEVTNDVNAVDDGKPTFFLMGEHHAREWPSAEIPTEFGIYVTSQYGSDARVTALLKKVRIVIVPVINPDGYIASRESPDIADTTGDPGAAPSLAESVAPPGGSLAYRRKNCDGASPSPATPCQLQYGVDPNRNYGQNWGGSGAGTDPNDQDYRGSGMWSEPETQAVHGFSQTHDITTLITMHNFASLVLRPPGVHDAGMAPDEPALKSLGDRMAADTGYTSEFGYQLYDTSGTTEDWAYAAQGTFGYTIEMGPSSDKGGNFHIAYDRAVVNQWTGSESENGKGKGLRDALLAAGEEAADPQQFSTLKGTAAPGEVLHLHKAFTTFSSDICTVEDTDVPCTAQGAVLPRQSQPDFLDYTTIVPPSGKFDWIVTPSTRPFELKAGKTEQWTLTCEDPGSGHVNEKRQITVDRGQTLQLDMGCGGVGALRVSRACVAKRKLALHVHAPLKDRPRKIVAYVNNKRVRTLRGRSARKGLVKLKLKGGSGAWSVSLVEYFAHGKKRVSTRTYHSCKHGQSKRKTHVHKRKKGSRS